MERLRRATLALHCAGCVAWAPCALNAQLPPTAPAAAPGDAQRWWREITTEVGTADCDSDDQCATVGVGAKACGGPEAFLAWSSKVSNPRRLEELAVAHRAARQQEIRRRGLMSDCRVVVDPGAACKPRAADGKRVCQLQGGRSSGAD